MNTIYSREHFLAVEYDYPTKVIAAGYLRQQVALEDGQSTYEFSFLKETREILPEKLLPRTDNFVATAVRMGIALRDSTLDRAEVIHTFPNVAIFGDEAPDLEFLYNGFLKATIDSTVLIEGIPTDQFRYVPESQQRAAVTLQNVAESENVSYGVGIGADSYCGTNGVIQLPYRLTIDGAQKNEFELKFPNVTGLDVTPASGSIQLVVELFGFLVSGASSLK